ncbi:P-loop containing nucleoside triphosphate hydrolase protein, partial [Blyttiomyces helicus]
GLGKTVQSISLMAHLAEHHNIWGPFLVITPASTLHNWQQEVAKFTPQLKALPYWGNQADRKVLRKFWSKKKLYAKDAPFHVLITSYQLIVTDEKHFQRIKWQYMILDEAQAIKSSTSARWKTLLTFNCRNRLLLTGTPIQNSMQELWALLHFIMPTLFDSHEEFSEWFSRDVEAHAENKGTLNEHQLKRLHMILKPFMLRRIKKDVENELGDKIEIEVICQLTPRQRRMYQGLKQKLSISDLLDRFTSLSDSDSVDSLMNLVMQFRKVCNHPELFERADVVAPLFVSAPAMLGLGGGPGVPGGWTGTVPYAASGAIALRIPKRVYREGGLLCEIGYRSDAGMRRLVVNDRFSALAAPPELLCSDQSFVRAQRSILHGDLLRGLLAGGISHLGERADDTALVRTLVREVAPRGIAGDAFTKQGFTHVVVPSMEKLYTHSAKMLVLERMLPKLKAEGHRVLIYFQMTKMIELMEEYLTYRQYMYLRLDGSTTISDRRDMVTDWQTRPEIFIFLLSTRAGGLGINLTAADTVIFYDSDWNPTVDQQAMDRAHRLGQTKQVTVYRLITSQTIEERILERAKQKDEIQKVVISGGEFKQVDFNKPKEVLSLLLDDEELE